MFVYILCVAFFGRLSSSSGLSDRNQLPCACDYVEYEQSNNSNCCEHFVRDIERLCGIDSDYKRHVNWNNNIVIDTIQSILNRVKIASFIEIKIVGQFHRILVIFNRKMENFWRNSFHEFLSFITIREKTVWISKIAVDFWSNLPNNLSESHSFYSLWIEVFRIAWN